MHDIKPPPPDDEAWRGTDPSPAEEDSSNIPPPPTYPPAYAQAPAAYRLPRQAFGRLVPNRSEPPPPVPVNELYSEPRPQRKWLRIPIASPLVTTITLLALVAIYAPILFSEDIANAFYGAGAKNNLLITEGEWWRLFTATLLHGPPYHILFNGYALYILGNELEAFFGRGRFFTVYWVSALGGSVASYAFSPALGVGASGAIFGLIGALAVYFGLHRNLFGKLGQAQFWNIIFVIVLNVGFGLSQILPIDNAAHIGGLVVGAAVGYVLCPRYALGEWHYPNARNLQNTNKDPLVWAAVVLITLDVIFAFFAAMLLYEKGIWQL